MADGGWDVATPDTPASTSGGWDVAVPDSAPETAAERMKRHTQMLNTAPSFGSDVKRIADIATDLPGKVTGPIAGAAVDLIPSLIGMDQSGKETTKKAFEYSSTPQSGADIAAAAHAFGESDVGQTIAGAGHAVHQGIEGTFGPEAAAQIERVGGNVVNLAPLAGAVKPAVAAVSDVVGTSIPAAERALMADPALAAGHEAATAAKAADAIDNRLRTAGFKTSPSTNKQMTGAEEKPSHFATGAEALDPAGVQADNIAANRPVVNGWGATDIGLPRDATLTEEQIASKETRPAATYDKVKAILSERKPINLETQQSLANAGQDSLIAGQELPAEVGLRANILSSEPQNAADLMKTISKLRRDGFKNKLSENTNSNALGRAQLDQANALEGELNQRVATDAPSLNGEYQGARKQFAKINTVRAALKGYNIDPQAVVKLADKNEGIDGGLRIIADAATHAPGDVRLNVPSAASLTRVKGGSPLGLPVIGHTAAAVARKVVGMTRGETPAAGLNAAASGLLKDRYFGGTPAPPETPPLNLAPPPGTVMTPNQPSLLRSGESMPVRDTGGLPPPGGLVPPLGNAFEPHQHDLLRTGGGTQPMPKAGPNIQENVQVSPMAEHHVEPGATLISEGDRTNPKRFISIMPAADGRLQVRNTWVDSAEQGKGMGQKNITDALDYANGAPLDGDGSVHVSQLRALFAAQKKGLVDFKFRTPELEAKAREMVRPGYVGNKILGRSGGPPVTTDWTKPATLGARMVD